MTNDEVSSVLPVGTIVADKYRVERMVGKGGMGEVVAVRHLKLDELFAIKVLVVDGVDRDEPIERFVREAKAAVKLKHNEHVARVTDVDTLPNGRPYMVMELLDGQDLDKILKERDVFAFHDACSYVVQACRALADAHKLGIIHRDLKPQNIFLTHRMDGSPCIKVLDFGISKHTLLGDSLNKIDLTQPCQILGSAVYMSPEQARSSKNVVPQSDIWSLGAVLYKLLTGRTPFARKTLFDVFQALLDDSPALPPSTFRPDIPAGLEAIILRCLEKSIERRYTSAHELMTALAPFTVPGETNSGDDGDAVSTLPLSRKRRADSMSTTRFERPGASGQAHSPAHDRKQGIPFKTQPLDAKSLHAALHDYLPQPPIPRPPAPSHPRVTGAFDVTCDAETPRIAPKKALADQPIATPAPDVLGTICVSSMIGTTTTLLPPREPLSSQPSDAAMLPWIAFPAASSAPMRRIRMLALASCAIVLTIILLLLVFSRWVRHDILDKPATSHLHLVTALPTSTASVSSAPVVPPVNAVNAVPTAPPSASASAPTPIPNPVRRKKVTPPSSKSLGSDEISDPYPARRSGQ